MALRTRDYRQKWNPNATLVFVKRIRAGYNKNKPFFMPGDRLPKKLRTQLGETRVRRWFETGILEIEGWKPREPQRERALGLKKQAEEKAAADEKSREEAALAELEAAKAQALAEQQEAEAKAKAEQEQREADEAKAKADEAAARREKNDAELARVNAAKLREELEPSATDGE